MKNYEKIKQMNVEEMAEFLGIPVCRYCVAKEVCEEKHSCKFYIKQWLMQEANK